jgi:hypothetical protein
MEDSAMTLARLSNNWFPSFPSLIDSFFEEYMLEVAAPGMKKGDFK